MDVATPELLAQYIPIPLAFSSYACIMVPFNILKALHYEPPIRW